MANFPNSVTTFTTRNPGDTIPSADWNSFGAEINAIEDGYINGKAPLVSSAATVHSLKVSSVATAAAQPRASVFNSGIQAISSASTAVVTFDSELYNVGSLHSTSANTSRLTVPAGSSGWYLYQGQCFVVSTGTGVGSFHLLKNSSRENSIQYNLAVAGQTVQIVGGLFLNGADFVELAFVTTGSTLSIGTTSSNFQNRFTLTKVW